MVKLPHPDGERKIDRWFLPWVVPMIFPILILCICAMIWHG